MAYGNSHGKDPGSRKPRPGAKRNGVGASSSTRGGKFSGKTSGGGKPKAGTSGLHAPRVATVRVLPSGIAGAASPLSFR